MGHSFWNYRHEPEKYTRLKWIPTVPLEQELMRPTRQAVKSKVTLPILFDHTRMEMVQHHHHFRCLHTFSANARAEATGLLAFLLFSYETVKLYSAVGSTVLGFVHGRLGRFSNSSGGNGWVRRPVWSYEVGESKECTRFSYGDATHEDIWIDCSASG